MNRRKKHDMESRQTSPLADPDEINVFAQKWEKKLLDSSEEINHETFAEECFRLGFGMDLGDSLKKTFPDVDIEASSGFLTVVGLIDDVFVLGSAILSYWRWRTHWMESQDLHRGESRDWFLLAFRRLKEISAQNGNMNKKERKKRNSTLS